jgi:hypothetical protein
LQIDAIVELGIAASFKPLLACRMSNVSLASAGTFSGVIA